MEAEAGIALASGLGFYVRPGFGFGGDKPIDYNFEVGAIFIF